MKSINVFHSKLPLFISLLLFSLVGNSQNIQNLSDLSKKCDPAVVRIYTLGPEGLIDGQASGCIISSTGIGITNFHVLAGSKKAIAIFPSGEKQEITKILDYNETADLIKFQISSEKATSYLTISKDSLNKGESVFTIGYPNGFKLQGESTLSTGIISGFRITDGIRNIQTTAPITHGSSGGGLFNSKGQLCGITQGTFAERIEDRHANLNKVVPVSEISYLNRDLNLSLPQFFNEISKTNSLAKAIMYFEKGEFEQALPLFIEHLKIFPSDGTAWLKAGWCAYFLYMMDKTKTEYKDFAIKACENGASLDQSNHYAIGLLSAMHYAVGNKDDGREFAIKCYEMAPDEWFSCNVMAVSCMQEERFEDAITYCDKSISICKAGNITTFNNQPILDKTYQYRGLSNQFLEKYEDALTDYNMSLRYNPEELMSLMLKFALCFEILDKKTEACNTISKIYDLWPDGSFGGYTVVNWKDAACGTVTITGPYIKFQSEENNYIISDNGKILGSVSPGNPLILNIGVKANVTYYLDIYKSSRWGTSFLLRCPIIVLKNYVVVNIKNNKVTMEHY